MNPKLLAVVRTAQKHGWSVEHVGEEMISIQKRWHRPGRRPRLMVVWHDGRIAKCR